MPDFNPIIITDEQFGVNSYVVTTLGHAFVIDPILNSKLMETIGGYNVDFMMVTHEHYDHIRSINEFKNQYGNISVICGDKAAAGLSDPVVNLSRYVDFLSSAIPFCKKHVEPFDYKCVCDKTMSDGQILEWNEHRILVKETPGHSRGSICILVDDKYLFAGDTIFRDYPTATRLPGGSTKEYRTTTESWLNTLQQDVVVYPGHTEPFLLKERYNKSH